MIDAKNLLDQFLGGAGGNQLDRSDNRGRGGILDNAGDMLGALNQRARENPLASGALAGGLAAILLGSKAGRKLTGSAVKYGGMAVIGGLQSLSGLAGAAGRTTAAAASAIGSAGDFATAEGHAVHTKGV